jgi:hypothetical protein
VKARHRGFEGRQRRQELSTLAVAKRGSIKGQNIPIPFPLTTVPRFANNKLLLTSSFAGGVKLWD